jgi:hypothetical protein
MAGAQRGTYVATCHLTPVASRAYRRGVLVARLVSLLSAAAILVACGARSALDDRATPAAGGGTSSGSGGGVAAPFPCGALEATGAAFALPEAPGAHQHRPAMVPLGGGPAIALVLGLDPIAPPGATMIPLADVSLDPTGAWPPALTGLDEIAVAGGGSFALAPRSGPTFSLLFDLESLDPPTGMVLAEDVKPQGNAAGTLFDPGPGTALFVISDGDHHLAAHTRATTEHPLALDLFTGAVVAQSDAGSACGAVPLSGGAIAWPDGFLVASSSGAVSGQCGAPEAVQLFRVSTSAASWIAPLGVVQLGAPIRRAALVPASDGGAWILTQPLGPPELVAPVRVDRVDASGTPVGAPIEAVAETAVDFAAAGLGGGFVIAWTAPGSPPKLGLEVRDASGKLGAQASIPLDPAPVEGPLALHVGADGATLVVAWSQQDAQHLATVRLARFACAAAP